jgi:hypothetical protein
MKTRLIVSFLIVGLIGFWGCEEDSTTAPTDEEILASFPGTYTVLSYIDHPGGDCTASDGVSSMCSGADVTLSEADCPAGICFDGVSTDEASCPDGDWYTGVCDNSNEELYLNETSCDSAGYHWITLGWMTLVDLHGSMSITFSEDGAYQGTDSPCRDETTGEEMVAYAGDPAACEAAGGSFRGPYGTWTLTGSTLTMSDARSDDEEETGTISGNTVTIDMSDPAHCECEGNEGCEAADAATEESTCTAAGGNWSPATCTEAIFTKS